MKFIIIFSLFIALTNGDVLRKNAHDHAANKTETVTKASESSEETDLTENLPTESNTLKKSEPIENKKEVTKKSVVEKKKEEKLPAKELLPKLQVELMKEYNEEIEEKLAKQKVSTVETEIQKIDQKTESPKVVPKTDTKSAKSSAERINHQTLYTFITSLLLILVFCVEL